MIIPIALPRQPSPGSPTLPPALAHLGSSELFLLELQGDLEVLGDKHGQLVGRLNIDDDHGKVRFPDGRFYSPLHFQLFTLVVPRGKVKVTALTFVL